MDLLGRTEEIILLSIWRLQDDAYGVSIRADLKKRTDDEWSLGAIYAPLQRLERKGLVRTRMGDPESRRGGRRKVFYQLTKKGRRALLDVKTSHETIWEGIKGLSASES